MCVVSCPYPESELPPTQNYVRPQDPHEDAPNWDLFGVTIDSQATVNARKVYTWLQLLPLRNENKYISGQHIGDQCTQRDFDNNMLALFEDTGKWPAMIGVDYFRGVSYDGEHATDSMGKTDTLIEYWADGGLTTVSAHIINPWTGGGSREKTYTGGGYADAYTQGTTAHTNLQADFDLLADHFLRLQDEGVVVLFRPFHEMNGPWFWWYTTNANQFIQLWRYWQRYLIEERGVHNLLYVFSPNASGFSIGAPHNYYPGDDYVDIIALDLYRDDLLNAPVSDYTDFIDNGKALGKPFGFGELGRNFNNLSNSETWDQLGMIEVMDENFPQTVFWQSWASWENANMAIVDLPHAYELMVEEPTVLTRDELIDLPVFRAAAEAYTRYYHPETAPIHSNLQALVPTSEHTSQRWAYTFATPSSDWNNANFNDDTWKGGMAPFGSPWVNVPLLTRFGLRFAGDSTDGHPTEIYLRKKFMYNQSHARTVKLRTFLLGNDTTFYINGVEILDVSFNHETQNYVEVDIPLDAGVLHAGTNVFAVHSVGNLSWGSTIIDAGIYLY